jgi:hypothetical protein
MKRITFALLATAATLAVASARADTRFSIGVNLGVPAYRPAPPVVVYAPPPAVCPPAPAVVVAPARGYWKDVSVRTWVPERWVVRPDRRGRPVRYCEPGYYTYRTERVWVENHDRGFSGRGYAYGYDRRHDGRDGWKR